MKYPGDLFRTKGEGEQGSCAGGRHVAPTSGTVVVWLPVLFLRNFGGENLPYQQAEGGLRGNSGVVIQGDTQI